MGRRLSLYLISWNSARIPTVTSPFTDHILDGIPTGCPAPDLLVLALQEVAPISYAFLGGKYLDPYIQAYVIALQNAADAVLGEDYTLIGRNNVGMTVVLVFVKDKNLHKVKSVQYGGVGCGLWEMGNKAGVGVKIEYEVSEGNDNWFANTVELNLVGAHLAPHEWLVDRRNKDWETIVRGLVFEPGRQSEEGTQRALLDGETELETTAAETKPVGLYSPNAHTFVMGDLNYRTALSRPSRADRLLFPQPQDRPSDITHFSKLIEGDQCRTERLSGRTLHGFSEANITFPPTYKYKVRKFENYNDDHWDWAKYRWPSWTDRILYLPLDSDPLQTEGTSNTHDGIQIHRYTSIPQIIDSDHKPVTCFLSIPAMPISAASAADALHKKSIRYNPPFLLDVGWREKRAAARKREVAVGVVSFFVTTSTGLGIMIGVVGGFLGVWWLLAG